MARALLHDISRRLRDLVTCGYVAKKLERFRNSAPPSPSRLCPRIFVSNRGPKKKYSDAESIMPLQNTLPLPNFNMLGWNCIFEVDNATPFKRLEIQQRGAKIAFHKSAAVCIRQHGAFSLSLFPSDCNAITTVDGWGKSYTDIIARTRGSRQRRNEEDRNAGRFCESHLLTTSGCEDEFTQPRDHSVAEPHGGNAIDFEHNAERKRTGSNCLPVPKRDCIPKKTLAPSFTLPLASIIAMFPHQICAPLMNFDDRHHFAIFAQRGGTDFNFVRQGKQNDGTDIPSNFDL